MFLFFKGLLSVLAVTMLITIPLKVHTITQSVSGKIVDQESNTRLPEANVVAIESDAMLGSVTDPDGNSRIDTVPPARMVPGYALEEMTRDSYLILNRNTLKVSSTLKHKFNAKHNLQTGSLKSNPPTFQKDLFVKDISLKSVAFRRAVTAPVLLIAAGVSTLDGDNDDNLEVQKERNRYIPNLYSSGGSVTNVPVFMPPFFITLPSISLSSAALQLYRTHRWYSSGF